MIYLDSAATSYPKPPAVRAAVLEWYDDYGVSADRGDSTRSIEVGMRVAMARRVLGDLCGVPRANVAFTSGATESLNLALRALLRPGQRVLTTAFEHSSVVRPLRALAGERGLEVDVVPPDEDLGLTPGAIDAALAEARPDVFVFTHASNVTGALFDAAAFCESARKHGAVSVIDVSQTAGLFAIDVGADLVAGSCHKGLHGPPGLGFLALRAKSELALAPQKQGGTGSSVALAEHPTAWPSAFEAGTPNTPAIFGLLAALEWLSIEGRDHLAELALARTRELEDQLAELPGFSIIPRPAGPRTPVVSVVHEALDPAELGAILAAQDIHARSGHHCAPWIHDHLGTAAAGTLRLSPGPDVSAADIAAAVAALAC